MSLPPALTCVQNGILCTRSTRYPVLIDPQGQVWRLFPALSAEVPPWLASGEKPNNLELCPSHLPVLCNSHRRGCRAAPGC